MTASHPNFHLKQFIPTLRILEQYKPVVVGGQAVNFWASEFEDKIPGLQNYQPLTSKDIDFLANLKAANVLAEAMPNCEFIRPRKRKTTPNLIGRVKFELNSQFTYVDFMSGILGVSTEDINTLKIPITIESKDGPFTIYMLNPILCMESRVENVISRPQSYDNPHGIRQLHASIHCAGHYLVEILQNLDTRRKVLKFNERILKFCLYKDSALKLYLSKGIDPSKALLLDDTKLGANFLEKRVPQIKQMLKKRGE